jgi:hypothetical protein
MKIFVSICSYRDPLLHYTLESLIENKSDRHEATYSILEQAVYKDSLEKLYPELVAREDVFYKRIDPQYSDGVGWARKVNSLNVRDEDFFYQIDSHMLFDPNWDRYLVEDYKKGVKKSGSKKVIIDGGTKTYTLDENGVPVKHIEANGVTTYAKYFMWGHNSILGVHGHHVPPTNDVISTSHLFAGNLFTHTEWLKNVGINHLSFFDGEEHLLTMTSFEAGYYMYAPTEIHTYHFSGSGEYTTKQWFKPVISMERYSNCVQLSIKQWTSYLENVEESVLIDYYKYCGVDYIGKKIEDRTRDYPALVNKKEFPMMETETHKIVDKETPDDDKGEVTDEPRTDTE